MIQLDYYRTNCCGRAFILDFPASAHIPTDKNAERSRAKAKERNIPFNYIKNLSDYIELFERSVKSYDRDKYEEEEFDEDCDEYPEGFPEGMCIEITLTDYQLQPFGEGKSLPKGYEDCKNWEDVIKQHGFELVYKFTNPNSKNVVNVYFLSVNKINF